MKQTIVVLCNAVISRAALLLLSLICVRWLDAKEFGIYSFLAISASSIASLSSFGVGATCNTTAARYYSTDHRFVSAVVTLSILLCAVLSLIFTAAISLAVVKIESTMHQEFIIVLLSAISILMTTSGALEGIFYGLKKFEAMLIISSASFLFGVATTVILILYYGVYGALAALLIYRIFQVSAAIIYIILNTKIRPYVFINDEIKIRLKGVFFGVSLPVAGAAILAGPTTTVSMIILERNSGLGAVAEFSLGYQLFLIATFIPGALGNFMLSRFSEPDSASIAILYKSFPRLLIYAVIALVTLSFSPKLAHLITDNVSLASSLMVSLGGAAFLYTLSTAFNSFWPAVERSMAVFWGQLMWGGALIFVAAIAAGTYGATSLGFGLFVGAFLQLCVHLILFRIFKREGA